ncbi:MAG: hypothetical protein UD961_04120 [Bacteroidales bacterium]|nr:hypothetical protein [Bacteroidales bacterium]
MKRFITVITLCAALLGCNKPNADDTRFFEENLKATMDQIYLDITLNGVTHFYIASQLNDILSGEENVYAEMFTEISENKWYSNLLNISFETGGKQMNAEGAEWEAGHYQSFRFLGEDTWLLSYENGSLSYEINLKLEENDADIFEATLSGNGEYVRNNVLTEFDVQDVNIKRQFVDNVLVRTTSTGVIKGDFYNPEDNDIARAFCELHLGSVPEYITGYNLTE